MCVCSRVSECALVKPPTTRSGVVSVLCACCVCVHKLARSLVYNNARCKQAAAIRATRTNRQQTRPNALLLYSSATIFISARHSNVIPIFAQPKSHFCALMVVCKLAHTTQHNTLVVLVVELGAQVAQALASKSLNLTHTEYHLALISSFACLLSIR